MLFNVSQLLQEPVGATRHHVLRPEAPIHGGSIVLTRMPTGVLVQGDIDVVLEAECSRCLTLFGYPRRVHIEEIYYQQVDVHTGGKLETEADTDSFLIDKRHTIDISEAVRQYEVMAADMQPLCRPDCPGICAQCGRDLTQSACTCEGPPLDPRWLALEALKHR
jgi:uncharacterized protein